MSTLAASTAQMPHHATPRVSLLPVFAAFLISNKLEELVRETLHQSRQHELPLMKHLAYLPEEQLVSLSMESTKLQLQKMADEQFDEYMKESLTKYKNDQLGIILSNQIAVEDITVGNYIRRKVFQHFSHSFTSNYAELQLLA